MIQIQREKKAAQRTPAQMAKAAMKSTALADLEVHGLSTSMKVTVEYMGIRHTLDATPTVKLETGEIGFYCGARGSKELPFEFKDKKLSFGVGFNVSTNLGIDGHEAILKHYGLTLSKVEKAEDEADLEAGEQV